MYLHISALGIILVVLFLIIYKRSLWIPYTTPYLPTRLAAWLSNYEPLASHSFADQVAAGLSSGDFDVEGQNLPGAATSGASGSRGEARLGLDAQGVEEVRRIMAINRCTFDQARLIRHNRHLALNGIAPDGTPLDRKAITRL